MKSLVLFTIVLAVVAADPAPQRPQRPRPPYVNRPNPPTGAGPHARIARSPEPQPQGSIFAHGTQHTTGPNQKPTWEAGYQHKVWENKHGSVSVNAGASKTPNTHTQGQAGITGSFKWRRSADPQGSIYAHGTQHTTGPNRKPTWEAGYQHKVWENKHGSVSVNAGASKTPNTHTQGQVGVTGSFRFRRSANPQGSIYAHGTQHTTGPNQKPTWEAGYQHKVWENKHGSVSVNAGASKTPNTHTQGQAGITGSFKW